MHTVVKTMLVLATWLMLSKREPVAVAKWKSSTIIAEEVAHVPHWRSVIFLKSTGWSLHHSDFWNPV